MKLIKTNPKIVTIVSVSNRDEVLFLSPKPIFTPYSHHYSHYNDYVNNFLHLFFNYTIHYTALPIMAILLVNNIMLMDKLSIVRNLQRGLRTSDILR